MYYLTEIEDDYIPATADKLAAEIVLLKTELAQARRLLRELWASVDAGVPSIDLMSRVVDELAKE